MSRRLTVAVIALLWIVPAIATVSITVALFPQTLQERPAWQLFGSQIVFWGTWILATPVVALVTWHFPLESGRLRRSIPVHLATAVAIALLYTAVYALLSQQFVPPSEAPRPFYALFRSYLSGRVALASVAYACLAGLFTAIEERRVRREQVVHTLKLQGELARAQLQTLQMQLQPHFFFNTLNTIAVLIRENTDAAAQMVVHLSDLMRRTLALSQVPRISLEEELAVLRRYLTIEETRFGDRLTVSIDVPDELLGLSVPTFILQPIVENAIRHGVAPRMEPGRIFISASRTDRMLELTVTDDGAGFDGAVVKQSADSGFGLAGTRDRLAVLHGDDAAVLCENTAGGGARVTLRFPAEQHG